MNCHVIGFETHILLIKLFCSFSVFLLVRVSINTSQATHPFSVLQMILCLYFCSIRLVSHTQKGTIYPPLLTIAYTDVLLQNPESQSVMVRSSCCLN